MPWVSCCHGYGMLLTSWSQLSDEPREKSVWCCEVLRPTSRSPAGMIAVLVFVLAAVLGLSSPWQPHVQEPAAEMVAHFHDAASSLPVSSANLQLSFHSRASCRAHYLPISEHSRFATGSFVFYLVLVRCRADLREQGRWNHGRVSAAREKHGAVQSYSVSRLCRKWILTPAACGDGTMGLGA